jgi:DNA topoisomerase-1
MMNLVIVESAAKAKTISKYLNDIPSLRCKGEFIVVACLGHIQDLPSKTLGIDKTTWQVTYNILPNKKDILHKITVQAKQAFKSGGKVYIASDMDVEGNAIASHIKIFLGLSNRSEYDRVVFNEITKSALEAAFLNPIEIDQMAVEAQETRRILDRIIGYELSPLLWRRFKKQKLSAGRVQTAALNMIVARQKEMQLHTYTPYWKLTGTFNIESTWGKVELKAVSPSTITTAEDALKILRSVTTESEWHACFTKTARNKSAPPPFTTSTLQQTCFQRFGLSTKSTMQIAQSLYEAGLITYMRTDSTCISSEMQQSISKHVSHTYGVQYVQSSQVKNKSHHSLSVQGAHEAIRPTLITTRIIDDSSINTDFREVHQKVYDLIWKRTIASKMADSIYACIAYTIQSRSHSGHVLHGSRNILIFDGYQVMYNETETETDTPYIDADSMDNKEMSFWDKLLNSKNTVSPICFSMVPDVERPKPLFNEATLVKNMEKEGIGRPSTYASIVNKLYDKKYVENGSNLQHACVLETMSHSYNTGGSIERTSVSIDVGGNEKNKLVPTPLGCSVIEYIYGITPYLMDCTFTRTMESDLDKVAQDESFSSKNIILNRFYSMFSKSCENALQPSTRTDEPSTSASAYELPPSIRDFPNLNASIRNTKYGPAIYVSKKKQTKIFSVTPFLEWRSISIDEITDSDVLFITSLPRRIPGYNHGLLAIGRYGLYIKSKRNIRLDPCLWQKCYEGTITGADIALTSISETTSKKQQQ